MTDFGISVQMFLQLAVVLAGCRLSAWCSRAVGQPEVVGQMIAGVLLGPSLMGWMAPEWSAWLFPAQGKTLIYAMGQLGLSLFMFLVGVEYDVSLLRPNLKAASAVSISGVAAPFVLGSVLAWSLHDQGELFTPGVSVAQGMFFLSAALSITAFPMLAKIISDRGLAATPLGALLLASGSIDDLLAWCVLAGVLAWQAGDWMVVAKAGSGTLVYVLLVRLLVRPLFGSLARSGDRLGSGTLATVLMLVCLGSWFTDSIGIYAVFGAFVMGLAVPRGWLSRSLLETLMPVVSTLLLPLFFVASGLKTRITVLDSPESWGIVALVTLAACLGKYVACGLAAKWSGFSTRDSLAVGSLMNARGLMELIILNIGLERSIITPKLYCIGVIMAIVTTLAATPLFRLARPEPVVPEA